MKLKATFSLSKKQCHVALYRFACALAPSSVRVDDIKIEALRGEPLKRVRIAFLIAVCRSLWLKRSKFGEPGTYGYVVDREYERADLRTCELLCVLGFEERDWQYEEKRDDDGYLVLQAHSVSRLLDFGQVKHRVVVSERACRLIENEGFERPVFKEVRIEGGHLERLIPPCWELRASAVLPKVANTKRLMCYGMGPTGKVEPFKGDYSRIVFIDDPPFALGEIHYRRRDLQTLGRFDIAQTFEHLWVPQRSLVISRRFYEFLASRGEPILVRPVRIDDN